MKKQILLALLCPLFIQAMEKDVVLSRSVNSLLHPELQTIADEYNARKDSTPVGKLNFNIVLNLDGGPPKIATMQAKLFTKEVDGAWLKGSDYDEWGLKASALKSIPHKSTRKWKIFPIIKMSQPCVSYLSAGNPYYPQESCGPYPYVYNVIRIFSGNAPTCFKNYREISLSEPRTIDNPIFMQAALNYYQDHVDKVVDKSDEEARNIMRASVESTLSKCRFKLFDKINAIAKKQATQDMYNPETTTCREWMQKQFCCYQDSLDLSPENRIEYSPELARAAIERAADVTEKHIKERHFSQFKEEMSTKYASNSSSKDYLSEAIKQICDEEREAQRKERVKRLGSTSKPKDTEFDNAP